MSNIRICKFINRADTNKEEVLTLCTEWSDAECKILIFGQKQVLLGELTNSLIEQFSNNLSISKESYIEETKQNFANKNKDIEFHVKDYNFKWRKAIWKRGIVKMQSVFNIENILGFLCKILQGFETYQNNIEDIENYNSILVSQQTKLETALHELIKVKQNMEHQLYQKFLFVLNTKKRKICELESILKAKDSQNQIYDTQTDDSQDFINDIKRRRPDCSRRYLRKRVQIASDNESPELVNTEQLKEESNSTSSTNCSVIEGATAKVDKIKEANIEDQDDSDEEICFKLTDDSTESIEIDIGKMKSREKPMIIEPDSDEDIFS